MLSIQYTHFCRTIPPHTIDRGIKVYTQNMIIGIGILGYPWVHEWHYGKDYFTFWNRLWWAGRINDVIQVRFMWFVFQIRWEENNAI